MQRLLNRAVWDTDAAMAVVRQFAVERLAPAAGGLAVAALDETGQQKQGEHTAGVKRQYMGCAGRVANGVNTVHCSYATVGGHALIGARIYVPAEQFDDQDRRTVMGVPADVVFRTKPQLAIDITTDAIAEGVMPPWCAGDEVYGRSSELRVHLEDHEVGYVLRVGAAFHLTLPSGQTIRVDALVTKELASTKQGRKRWQTLAVAGSKGDRIYSWAWVATASPNHTLLIRKHRDTGELAYHYCYTPPGQPVTLRTLVRVRVCGGRSRKGSSSAKTTSDSTTPRPAPTPHCYATPCWSWPRSRSAQSLPLKRKPGHQPRSCPPHRTSSHPPIPV
jgi:hypothetical protein